MQDLRFLFEIGLEENLIGFFLSFAEDDGASVPAAVEIDDIGDDGITVVVGAVEGEVLDGLGGTDVGILDEVDELAIGGEVGA